MSEVSTADALIAATKGDEPKVIRITGAIGLPESVRVGSNTTLVGVGPNAKLTGGGLQCARCRMSSFAT